MTKHDDVAWAQQVLRPADPLDEAELARAVADVRSRVARPSPRQAPARTPRRGAQLVAAAAAVALLLVAPLTVLRSDPAWAVERIDDRTVRVELAESYGRGPDPDGLVEALREAGVDADVAVETTWWPLHFGRVVGLQTNWSPMAGGLSAFDGSGDLQDLSRYGIVRDDEVNGYVLDTELFARFDGRITIQVGRAPWA